jgi:tRNA_anti-like
LLIFESVIRIVVPLLLVLIGHGVFAVAQETVTIPKSRLEELERKEAELERLKGTAKMPPGVQNPAAKKQDEAVPRNSPPQTSVSTPAPAVTETRAFASLAPLEKNMTVLATDLAAHYRANAGMADERYRKHTFKVQGEIVGFEKPMLVRNYYILLKTAEPQTRVICDFYPPDNFKAVYTINGGTALVGTLSDTRVPIAKVGDNVVIEGRCKGLSGGGVKLSNCELKVAK